ncbi:hypothetical protein [Stakelama tenebrarum]|uniref:hypothetical protein n=1 Tax=Stakelama tenebrarum TaxID=2711215 RepID=UPI0013EAC4AA|nr:hypothetical protein [Sphingosinithalassobacter tenebrarum]
MAEKDDKKARLAEQLRANLRRRKAQARELRAQDRQEGAAVSADDAESPDRT